MDLTHEKAGSGYGSDFYKNRIQQILTLRSWTILMLVRLLGRILMWLRLQHNCKESQNVKKTIQYCSSMVRINSCWTLKLDSESLVGAS
jgi:hypothetical protein